MQCSFLCLTEVVTEVVTEVTEVVTELATEVGRGRGIQEAFKEMLCFFLTNFHFPYSAFLRFLQNLILHPQPFS